MSNYTLKKRQAKRARKRQREYLRMQRTIGVFILLATFLLARVADGDITIGLFTIPVACWFIFSRKRIFDSTFYYSYKERKENE